MNPSTPSLAHRSGWLRRASVAAALAAAGALPAHADVINFEAQRGLVGHNDSFVAAGVQLRALSGVAGADDGALVGAFLDGADADSCNGVICASGDASIYYAALDDSYLSLRGLDSNGLHLGAFDAAYIANPPLGALADPPGLIEINGTRANGSVLTERFALSALGVDGFPFRHITPSAAFSAAAFSSITIVGYGCQADTGCAAFSSDRAQYAIDNISLVPEPAAAAMFGLGLAWLGALAMRRSISSTAKDAS